jgi:NADPH:quinone reductase-like Zn-dependent oxidoreductase/NADP-dependent 3-hydroxy acid dehydrogenase YdfG/SAM-dependent methyltransferase
MPEPATFEPASYVSTRCTEVVDSARHYEQLSARGLTFGASLQGVRQIRRRDGEALGDIGLPDPSISGRGDFVVHPASLDACLQVMDAAIAAPAGRNLTGRRAYLPFAIGSVQVFRSPGASVSSHARVKTPPSENADALEGEVTVLDEHGVVARVSAITLRAAADRAAADASADPIYEVAWERRTSEEAAWLPRPAEIAARTAPALARLLDEHGADAYQAAFVELEKLSTDWIRIALGQLGWKASVGELVTTQALAARLGIVPRFERLLARFLRILAEDGVLSRQGAHWKVERALDETGSSDPPQALLSRHPSSRARISVAANCGPHLADILRGSADPLQLLFPGGSTELAEALYRDSPEAKAFNQLLREAVSRVASSMPAAGMLRVLEVGGGTGGTTAWVAPSLPADRTRYVFTDIGHSMVTRAREKFAAYSFMEFQTFDLEHEPAAQGLGNERFDVILASNVIHATSDLRQTLRRLHELLVPGGVLLMLEVVGPERWVDITFGLTEGWWLFTDCAERRDYPLLSQQRWLEVLKDAGLEAAVIGGEDPRSRQTVLAARRTIADDCRFEPGDRWLVLADSNGVGKALGEKLRSAGQDVTLITRDEYSTQPPEAIQQRVAASCRDMRGVIYLWGLDLPESKGHVPQTVGQRAALGPLISVVQALGTTSHSAGHIPRLWIVTTGAQAAGGSGPVHVPQATLWGLGRCISLEHPELHTVRIDLDPAMDAATNAVALLERLTATDREEEVALRANGILVPRLVRLRPKPTSASLENVRLEKPMTAVFEDMSLQPLARSRPLTGQVEIRVMASGLNFRDVMNAVAVRDDPEPLGGECAGRVVAAGEDVHGLAVGDHVVAIAEGSFGTYVTTDQRHIARIPPGLGFTEAATLPFAFMTAQYALNTLGALRCGETVLIHAAAGGVGMAAIQLAQRVGATIIATAGSEAKRDFLRSLGITHVLSSRTLEFVDLVRDITNGTGVDLVLNSLSGEFIPASVATLAANGRFLELGKRDIWSRERFLAERPVGRYFAIDLAAQRYVDPDASFALFAEVMAMVERGEIGPLPLHTFPLEQAAEAFQFMAQARHIGKIVLTQHDPQRASFDELDPNATYLITGGLAGLGLITACRMVERGARHLVLMGRREPSEAARAELSALRAKGAQIIVDQADVTRREDVERVLASIQLGPHPLRGIVHSAGTLSDGALMQQRWDRFVAPLGPKVDGTWMLHELTRGLRLDFFVMYSSIASMLGSPGQSNHAAANAFMDALAARRRSEGLPALSISWGAWSEIGAAADRKVDQKVGTQGVEPIAPARGLELLDTLMRGEAAHVGVFPVRWPQFLSRPGFTPPPFFNRLGERGRSAPRIQQSGASTTAAPLLVELKNSTALRRYELLLAFVSEHVARIIGATSPQAIDPRQPLKELGLDSLMAVELRNRLGTAFALSRSLPATLVFDYPTLDALATFLERELAPAPAGAADAGSSSPSLGAAVAHATIDNLSDEEIERMYARKMARA